MNIPGILVVLITALLALSTDMPQKMKDIFNEAIATGQQVATAGDLRSMSNMLDAYYFKRGRYPSEKHFEKWLNESFRGGELKSMTLDHWGNAYTYTVTGNGKTFKLRSNGADGIADTEDDMVAFGP